MADEYIKKSKALDELNYIVQYYGGKSWGAIEAHEAIYMMEPEDVRPVVRGRWIGIDDLLNEDWECSVCGEQLCGNDSIPKDIHFCPNCGAQMDADMREV